MKGGVIVIWFLQEKRMMILTTQPMCQTNLFMKAKVKCNLIRYYWSGEIKAKWLMSAASNTVNVVEVEDTEDSSAEDSSAGD